MIRRVRDAIILNLVIAHTYNFGVLAIRGLTSWHQYRAVHR